VRSDVGIATVEAALDGHRTVALEPGGAPLDLRVGDVPSASVRVLRPAAPGPLRLDVRDETVGLNGVPGFVPRPAELSRSTWADGESVVVTVPSSP
jgi:hypothetical protein